MSRSRVALLFVAVFLATVTLLAIGRQAALALAAALDSTPRSPAAVLERGVAPVSPLGSSGRPAPRQDSPPTSAPTPAAPSQGAVTVAVSVLNVRAGPGLDNEIIDQVMEGERLVVLSSQPGWIEVNTPTGTHGYVSRLYVLADGEAPRAEAIPAPSRPGGRGSQRSSPQWGGPQGGWNLPGPGGEFGSPPGMWGPPDGNPAAPAWGGSPTERATDDAGNSVQVYSDTSDYSFSTDEFLRLLRDENITGQTVTVMLTESQYDNRSATTFGSMTIDCNPINIPTGLDRPSPPGNGKAGQAFCNAVGLHEIYHLISLARSRTGGGEGEADRFANNRVSRYALIQAR